MQKKTLYRWHRRLGLALGVLLFLLAVSGVVITYRDELLPRLYPDLMAVTPGPTRVRAVDLARAARAHLGDQPFTHLYTSEHNDTASMIFYRPGGALLPHLLALDPYSGEVRGSMPLVRNVFGVMLYLHANFLVGSVGSWLVGLSGLVLAFFFFSGLVLWWPRGSWWNKLKLLPRSGVRGVHRGVGLFLGLPLLFSGLTGFVLAFDLTELAARAVGGAAKPEELARPGGCALADQLRFLETLSPEEERTLISVHFCTPKNALMKVSRGLASRDGHEGFVRTVVDPVSGEVTQRFDSRRDPPAWHANALLIFPLHSGSYFGGWGRILNVLTGLGLALLFLTGGWPTWRKILHRK